MYETAAHHEFKAGDSRQCLIAGWGKPETAHVWSVEPESELRVPLLPGSGDLFLQLLVTAFTHRPFLRQQRLGITVNGRALGEEAIQGEAAIGYRLPEAEFGNPAELAIRLHHPDALVPKEARFSDDERRLGIALHELLVLRIPPEPATTLRTLPPLPFDTFDFSPPALELVRGLTALTLPELAVQFESLGHNCEFGMVQRRFGAEPMGFFRFAGIRPHALLRGLDLGFPRAEDTELFRVYADEGEPGEYMVSNDLWGMESHTERRIDHLTEEAVKQEQSRKLRLYRRKLFEVLETGEKLFVFQHPDRLSEALMMPLLMTLRSYGPNALLFVRRDRSRPAGTVERLRADLYMGNIDRLAPVGDVGRLEVTPWVSLCANAYRLWREEGGGA